MANHYAIAEITPLIDNLTWHYLHTNRATKSQNGNNSPIKVFVLFDNGYSASITCQPSLNGNGKSYSEMALHDPDSITIQWKTSGSQFSGMWELDYDDDKYIVHVINPDRSRAFAIVTSCGRYALVEFLTMRAAAGNISDLIADAAMDYAERIPAFPYGNVSITFDKLLNECDGDTYRRHGFMMWPVDHDNPVLSLYPNIILATQPENQLVTLDDLP